MGQSVVGLDSKNGSHTPQSALIGRSSEPSSVITGKVKARYLPLFTYFVLTFAISWTGFLWAVGPRALVDADWQAERKFLFPVWRC